jgi:hypothetical protein
VPKEKRYFMSDENIPRRYFYEVENWVKEQEHPRRRARITEDDLPHVDFMVIKVIPEDNLTDVSYNTVWGPFDDWAFIEGILAYDYGDEGSRLYPRAA